MDKIKERILTDDNLKELIRLINEEIDGAASEYQYQLDSIVDGIADTNRRLGILYDVLETGKLSLEYLTPLIQQLRQRLAELQARKWEIEALLSNRRVELASSPDFSRWIEDSRALLSDTPMPHKKPFIRTFVKEIKVTGNDVVLKYTSPLPPQGLTEEKLRVISSVHYGGAGVSITRTFYTSFNLA